jgi:hypothetical protein
MLRYEYDRTRKMPERKRATRNGKRAVDSFIDHVRERTAIEHPEYLDKYDTDITVRLMVLYFYFTKYIANRWNVEGFQVSTIIDDGEVFHYTDNTLEDEMEYANRRRVAFIDFMAKAHNEAV